MTPTVPACPTAINVATRGVAAVRPSELGKGIELAVFPDGNSTELQSRADRVLWIDDFADDVRHENCSG